MTVDADDLNAAWDAVHDALPTGWTIGPPSHHVEAHERPWHVLAVDLRRRAKRREYVEATGWTEAEALPDLAAATAWLAPLPPFCRLKTPPMTVSAGDGRRPARTVRSTLAEPTTMTSAVRTFDIPEG